MMASGGKQSRRSAMVKNHLSDGHHCQGRELKGHVAAV
jgi:hypothetical protein